MKATTNNVYEVLSKFVEKNKGKVVSWLDMVNAVNGAGIKVSNWLMVRGVLQYMKDNKMVEKTPDVMVEEYKCN